MRVRGPVVFSPEEATRLRFWRWCAERGILNDGLDPEQARQEWATHRLAPTPGAQVFLRRSTLMSAAVEW